MIETITDIEEMLRARFPGARCDIVHGRSSDAVVLKGKKATFKFSLSDYRKSKGTKFLHEMYKGRLCLSFNYQATSNVHQNISYMSPINEFSADEIVKFITDNSTFKPRKIVQLDLFECMRGITI